MSTKKKLEVHPYPIFEIIKPFVFGGIAGSCATSIIQPIDTVKVQI